MAYLVGIVLFALAIFVFVCLHEAGHMLTAKAFGMKVTRYFAGFGPTVFSFRRGETEYGLKALPLGGFVKIVGMTPQDDDVAPEDQPRAMWRFPVWQRTVVMAAGSVTHFILGFLLLWVTLAFVGIPNPAANDPARQPATVTVAPCVVATEDHVECTKDDVSPSPAQKAGLRDGDLITRFNGQPIHNYEDLVNAIRSTKPGPATMEYQRDGQTHTVTVDLVPALRHPMDNPNGKPTTVAALGVTNQLPKGVPETITYGPVKALGQSGKATVAIFGQMGAALKNVPAKVPALWDALNGKPRDPNTPVSVVGATRLGGETAAHHAWSSFMSLLIVLNFFVGVFNLLPLLPLDGGHIAVLFYEKIRDWIRGLRGKPAGGPVDYTKLSAVTMVFIFIGGAVMLLTITADIVNPIRIGQ
ncbi:MAG TPA: site-2 protease family protein [Micromonosporaceae bacterium]